jgi:hypothetical protein
LPIAIAVGAKAAGINEPQTVNRLTAAIEAEYSAVDSTKADIMFYENLTHCDVENLGTTQAEDVRIRFWGHPRAVVVNHTLRKASDDGVVSLGAMNPRERIFKWCRRRPLCKLCRSRDSISRTLFTDLED